MSSAQEWDAVLGVWVGERAAACDTTELPDPLYILGYGSLIWRPGSLLENYVSYKCTALGMMRLFAQKSCDHRGTPEFPGLVLNLVEDSVLEKLGYRSCGAPQSTFRGLVFLVPPEDKASVIEELDYRERGGYHRHIIQVQLDNDGSEVGGKVVKALVYTGAPDNPNFYLPPADTATSSLQSSLAAFNLHKRNVMTDTIAAAVGPSGPNVDYLCNLDKYLNTSGMHDPFLAELATSVRLRLGVWRGRLYRSTTTENDAQQNGVTTTAAVERTAMPRSELSAAATGQHLQHLPFTLLGWGSNEFLQLSNQPEESPPCTLVSASATELNAPLDAHSYSEALLAHRYRPTVISHALPPPLLAVVHSATPVQELSELSTTATSIAIDSTATTSTTPTDSSDCPATPPLPSPLLAGVEDRYVVAGGGTSVVVDRGVARIWGKLLPELVRYIDPKYALLSPADQRESEAWSKYNRSIAIEGVQGIAVGHDHLLLLLRLPKHHLLLGPYGGATDASSEVQSEQVEVVVALGSDSHGQCSGAVEALRSVEIAVIPQSDVLLVPSSSMKSSLTDGNVVFSITSAKPLLPLAARDTVGDSSDSVPADLAPRILKLAVGLRHSAALTVDGRLLTWGDQRHGQVLAGGASSLSWRPTTAPLVDVTCGAKYTVFIDALGVVYRLGAPLDAHTKGEPVLVEGLPFNVRWQRVTSGWSHVVLRGLTADSERKLVFYAWGKQHMGQYLPASGTDTAEEMITGFSGASVGDPLSDSVVASDAPLPSAHDHGAILSTAAAATPVGATEVRNAVTGDYLVEAPHNPSPARTAHSTKSTGNAEYLPRPLAPLPDGHHTVEVWCGSEFTVAADEQGHLWAMGWNEHGNLGIGPPPRQVALVPPPPRSSESVIGSTSSSGGDGSAGDGNNFNVVREWRRVKASSASAAPFSQLPTATATPTATPTVSTSVSTSNPVTTAEQIRQAEEALWLAIRRTSKHTVGNAAAGGSRFLSRTTPARVEIDTCTEENISELIAADEETPLVLAHVWEGAVACGGGHTLCLP